MKPRVANFAGIIKIATTIFIKTTFKDSKKVKRIRFFFFYIYMTYNLQRKIEFTITRYIKNIYTWEKMKLKKR